MLRQFRRGGRGCKTALGPFRRPLACVRVSRPARPRIALGALRALGSGAQGGVGGAPRLRRGPAVLELGPGRPTTRSKWNAMGLPRGMKKGCLPFLADSLEDVERREVDGLVPVVACEDLNEVDEEQGDVHVDVDGAVDGVVDRLGVLLAAPVVEADVEAEEHGADD